MAVRIAWAAWVILWLGVAATASAQGVDHPVITELFTEPPGLGGPVGRDPLDPHQEFIEIYIPPLADLAPGLDKDALSLTLYDVEGDATSPGLSLVNYRIDLPAFDLDPSNGMTGLPRPPSGLVVLGWVDYVGNPPTDLAGTPASRIGLVNGGITASTDYTFIAINGAQFSGTTNFPVPDAVSHIDTVSDPVTGKIEQGSGALLLVDRSDPGYVAYCGQTDPAPCNSFPNLAAGTGLGVSSLLDGFAPNDDSDFRVDRQPYAAPTGDNIDLEFVLPQGGAFSLLVPQLPEEADGYQRLFVDLLKTSEDGVPGNEDPALDAVTAYRSVASVGPFSPTPGRAPATTSAAALSVAESVLQQFQVLTNTSARPGIVSANTGGDFSMALSTTPAAGGTPGQLTVAADSSTSSPLGQAEIAPAVAVSTFPGTTPGHVETISIQVDAAPAGAGDPAVLDPTATVSATFTAIDPTQGQDALGAPFQATAFLAIQTLPDAPLVTNEVAGTSLGLAIAAGLGTTLSDVRGNGAALANSLTDLADPLVVDPMIASIPDDPLFYIDAAGPTGSLVATVQGSAEVASGATTYADSFNLAGTLVQARHFPLDETPTSGGSLVPSERLYYADARGAVGNPQSGLSDVLTGRDFELALIETNLGPLGFVETGATDDFGLAVRVGSTRAGASVVPGEIVMLSFTGGLEGADIDTLNVPPYGGLTNLIYVDLDPLDSVLGAETITDLFVIDGSGNGEIDVIEVITVPELASPPALVSGVLALAWMARRRVRRYSR